MLRDAHLAFVQIDVSLARDICARDDEGVVEQEQLLRRRHRHFAAAAVDVGVGVVEGREEGVELLAADAAVDGAPHVVGRGDPRRCAPLNADELTGRPGETIVCRHPAECHQPIGC